jgi:hypothetical protein
MSNLIIGFGVQGKKRLNFLKNKKNTVIVDPFNKESNYKNIQHLKDIKEFKKAYICTPESEKFQTIKYLLKNKKHVLVEKPLTLSKTQNNQIEKLIKKAIGSLLIESGFARIMQILNGVVPGWTSMVTTISFFSGIIILLLSMIGEYLSVVLLQTLGTPAYREAAIVKRGQLVDTGMTSL